MFSERSSLHIESILWNLGPLKSFGKSVLTMHHSQSCTEQKPEALRSVSSIDGAAQLSPNHKTLIRKSCVVSSELSIKLESQHSAGCSAIPCSALGSIQVLLPVARTGTSGGSVCTAWGMSHRVYHLTILESPVSMSQCKNTMPIETKTAINSHPQSIKHLPKSAWWICHHLRLTLLF